MAAVSSNFRAHGFPRFLAPGLSVALVLGLGLGSSPALADPSTDEVASTAADMDVSPLALDRIPEPCVPGEPYIEETFDEDSSQSASPSASSSASSAPSPTPTADPSPSTSPTPSVSPSPSASASASETEAAETPLSESPSSESPSAELSERAAFVDEEPVTESPSSSTSPTESGAAPSPEIDETDEPVVEESPSSSPVSAEPESEDSTPSASPSASPSVSPSTDERAVVECVGTVSGVVATPGANSVTLSWGEPSGIEAGAYFVRVVGEDRLVGVAAPASGVTVSGLRNGIEYGFVVIAANEDGSGVASVEVRATPTTGAEGEVAGLIVGFADGVQVLDAQTDVPGENSVDQVGLTVSSEVIDGVHTVDLSESVSIAEAREIAADLASDPAVAWAEPDQFVFTAATDDSFPNAPPNDEQYASNQWNLWDTYGIGVGDGADEMTKALVANQGEGTTIAVIDTGIAPHGDLDEQLVPGYDFVSDPQALASVRSSGGALEPFDADSTDESRFGARGWDTNPADPGDWRGVAPVRDSSWHGTKIAGVIAAQANNDQAIIGVTPQAKVQPIRALSWRGGLLSDIAASITWASGGAVDGVPVNETPADVINMSFALESVCSVALQGAINAAFERGSVLVAAAGNANDDVAKYAPANCENVISVGATGRDGLRAAYSNYGPGVDISAPGGAITGDGGVLTTSNTGLTNPVDSSTATTEGTSVAAAHVSAAAAFITAWQPAMTALEIRSLIVGPDSVRPFAEDTCDADPAKECGNGILNLAQIAATGEPGVNMSVTVGDTPVSDGSTVASGTTVGLGTAGLLSPGVGYRELRTTLDPNTDLASGSAVAPEGWAIQYSTNSGSSWTSTQPTPASSVTDVKASATVAAGLIEGTSQIYSSETTASIPSTNFSASTGGDGWDTFFYEDYVFNIFHHANSVVLDCHYRSDGERCTGYKSTFSGYTAGMRSGGWVDATTGKLYALTQNISTSRAGAICIDVSQSSGPVSCGFIQLSTTLSSTNNYNYLTESEYVGRRFFGAVYGYDNTLSRWGTQLLCYDATTQSVCPGTPISLDGGTYDQESLANVRPVRVQDKILVKTSTRIYCYVAATMDECTNQANWPVVISSATKTPVAPHTTTSGVEDGICYQSGCFDLEGNVQASWVTPFILGYSNWAMHAVIGGLGGTRYFWAAEPLTVRCFDYATNQACKDGSNNIQTKDFSGYNLIYSTKPDPENPSCIWVNSDAGRISVFDAQTLNTGCSNNPVITLQPSQFAPRYACSTASGITEWTALRLVSIGGGGAASNVTLTVRDATGAAVTGWSAVPVTLGSTLDMTGLNPGVSGSRPTFSFTFAGVSGTISTAVIALDYKGKGPELCIDVVATSGTPVRADVSGTMTERVGAEEIFSAQRYFQIGAATSLIEQSVPSAPLNLTGAGVNTSATLTFNPPTSDGNLTLGDYQLSRDGGSTWSDIVVVNNGDGTLSTRVTGLTLGTTYPMRLAATNLLGRGASASLSVTTQTATIDTLPDTPVNLGPITLAVRTNEGIDITYTTSSTSCSVTGTTVTLVSQGLCVISASAPSSGSILAYSGEGDFTVLPAYVEVTEPGTPRTLTATPSSTQVALAWTAPLADGGAAITDYLVQYKSGSTWTLFNDGTSTGTTAVVPGLTNGTLYSFRIAAVNSEGVGAYTDSVTATPATVPGAATSLSASRSSTSATLSWSAPSSNGGSAITDYTVEYKLSAGASWTSFSDGVRTTTGATVTGLDSGDSYDFRVSAVNAIGQGAFTSTANLTATAGNEQVVLTWTQPTFTGGEVFDHYEVEYRVTGTSPWFTFSSSVATTTSTVNGLSNGTSYDFRVAIVTSASTSSYTSVATSTPQTTPSAPGDAVAIPGNRQVELTWTTPSNGGSAITDYIIDFKASTATSWTRVVDPVSSATGVTITSLPNGTLFDFRIASVNAVGTGAYSATFNATPRTVPGTPTGLSATPSNGAVSLAWAAPSVTGGAAITDYAIEYRLSTAFGWTTFVDGLSSVTSATVPGLTNGALYEFRVSAVNEAGAGTASSVVSGRPFTVPGAPTSLAVSDSASNKILTWTAPTSNGGSAITDYRVDYKVSSSATWVTFSDGTSSSTGATITGLTSDVLYDFRVAAVNAAGTSDYTSTVNVTTVPGASQVTVSWTAPTFTGGEVLDRYELEYRLSTDTTWTVVPSGTSTSAVVTGLVNGSSYDFRVITYTTTSTSSYSSLVSATPRSTPGVPQNLVLTSGNGQLDVSWMEPASTGGSAITDYVIEYQATGASSWTTLVDGVGTTLSTRIPDLDNGTEYRVRVAAVNAVGTGSSSSVSTATPMTTPGQATGLGAVSGDAQMTLSWSAPASNGGTAITDYLIEYRLSSATSWTVLSDGVSTALTATVGGLTNGSLYQFRVAAINAVGTGSVSGIASGTPKTTPGVPTSISSTIGDRFVSLTWTAPSNDGGSVVTDYTIEYKLSADSVWTVYADGVRTLPSVTISGLTNNSAYDFRVAATNSEGSSSFTTPVSATPLSVPGAPTDLVAIYGNTTTVLTWVAPASDGGSAITDYVIQYRPSSTASWSTFNDGVGTGTSRTITGLTNGTTYLFRVAAVNIAGTSLYSGSESTIPRTVPTAPLSLAAARGNLQVTLTWNAPSSTGGADITDYLIEYKENTASTWTTFTDAVSTGRSQIILDLVNGTLYNFRVSAINSEGTGSVSSTANGTPSTVAGSPTSVTLTPASTSLGVSWTAPASNGGAAITNYIVQYKVSTAGSWTTLGGSRTSTSANITGLTNGTTYSVQIIATNVAGNSSASTEVTAAPRTTPGAPTALTATFGDGQASLAWTAPVSTGGAAITDYVLEYKRSTDSTWTEFTDGISSAATGVVTGLTNGTPYDFRIRAVNAAGQGTNSTTATATPLATPSAPVGLEGAEADQSVVLTWAAPLSDGGTARLNYTVRYRVTGASSWTSHSSPAASSTSATLTGLVNGTSYNVEVAAVNAQGTGTAAQVTVIPRTTPGMPTGLSATAGNAQVSLSWVAPAADGGAVVTDYVIEYRSAGTVTWLLFTDGVSAGTTVVVTGLSNGSVYEFAITAVNEAGDGLPTSEVTASPRAPASPPTEPIASITVPTLPTEAIEVELTFTEEGVLLINGVPVSLDITPSPDGGSWQVNGPDFSISFTPQVTSSGILTGPGRALSAPAGGWVAVSGDGYKGSTTVKVYLIPRPSKARSLPRATGPIYLGQVEVLADGTFDIRITLPADIDQGNYILQVNGLSPQSSVRSVNMALGVTAPESAVEAAAKSMAKKAFFQPRSARFTETGLKRLRTVHSSIPDGAQDVVVSVTGVSVSMDDLRSNLLLAGKRAQRIVNYLQRRDIDGQYNVTVNTSVKFGSADRLTQSEKRSNKPLTTVAVTFTAAS